SHSLSISPHFFFFNHAPTTAFYTLSLHDALPIFVEVATLFCVSTRHIYRLADAGRMPRPLKIGRANRWSRAALDDWIAGGCQPVDRKSTRLNSSHVKISYAVFCLKKKKKKKNTKQ